MRPKDFYLDETVLVDEEVDCAFVKECFTPYGGFAKFNFLKDKPDVLHTFYSLAAMSLGQKEDSVKEIEPLLAIPKDTFDAFIEANK